MKLAHRGDQRQVEWHVGFLSRSGRPLEEVDGVLALPSAPTHCEQLMLAVPFHPYMDDAETPEFWPLKRAECRVERSPQAQCRVLTAEDDTRALVARFVREFDSGEIEILTEPGHCELIPEHCVAVADEQARGWVPHESPTGVGYDVGFVPRVPCSRVEAAVQACHDADARREEDRNREQLCRGLVLATRTSGAVDLQVVGPDGVEWGRETVDLPGTRTKPESGY